jgi:cyclic-di-GMP-binding biofilm dispersal mediator protein
MDFQGKKILVIGSSGVFGALISQNLVARGAHVYGSAKDAVSAERLPAQVSTKFLLDLENPDSIEGAISYLGEETIDGIINAAGVVGFGRANETKASDAQRLMQINHLGPAALISGLYEALKRSEGSFVASITGVVAEKVFPGMSAYTASKSAHSAFLSSIALEWRRDKIQITEARPGHTETGLATRALFGQAPAFPQGMTPEHVVEVILTGIENGTPLLSSEAF